MASKIGILNLFPGQLTEQILALHMKRFRADQVLDWIYERGATSFDQMTDISKSDRLLLDEKFYIYRPRLLCEQKSGDGTIKFLLSSQKIMNGGIEAVFIPDKGRNTICVSSQIGCAVGCRFCNTGRNGFQCNLAAEEILGQILFIKDIMNSWLVPEHKISNIVFMGMGEPLFNIDAVQIALNNLTIGERQGLAPRRITVSSSGIVPILSKIAADFKNQLAISLHAPNDEIRSKIMPINNQYPLAGLMGVCREFNRHHPHEKITFEYLMLQGVNDSLAHAGQLIKLLHGLKYKINLIKYNPWEYDVFEGSSDEQIERFFKFLKQKGATVTVRRSKGQDIMAACGQLRAQARG